MGARPVLSAVIFVIWTIVSFSASLSGPNANGGVYVQLLVSGDCCLVWKSSVRVFSYVKTEQDTLECVL